MINKILYNKKSKVAWMVIGNSIVSDRYEMKCIQGSNLIETGKTEHFEKRFIKSYDNWILLDSEKTFKLLYGVK